MKHLEGFQKLSSSRHQLPAGCDHGETRRSGAPETEAWGEVPDFLRKPQRWSPLDLGHGAGPCRVQSAGITLAV